MATTSVASKKTCIRRVKYNRKNRNNTMFPVNRLPFIAQRKDGRGRDSWNLPQAAGYGNGCDMGKAAAQAFMKALRASQVDTGGCLQSIVLSLGQSGFDFENDNGRRGQVVGFFSYLDSWLVAAAKEMGTGLDRITEAQIETAMTNAASDTEAEYDVRYHARMKALGIEDTED